MQVRREAFDPAHRLSILVRPHGYMMGAVAHVDPCGSGMHDIQPRVLRSQLPRQLFPLLSIHPTDRHCSFSLEKWTRLGPVAIGLKAAAEAARTAEARYEQQILVLKKDGEAERRVFDLH